MIELIGIFFSIFFILWGLAKSGVGGLKSVSSDHFSVLINETPKGFFSGPKGSKTGGSPFAFPICAGG